MGSGSGSGGRPAQAGRAGAFPLAGAVLAASLLLLVSTALAGTVQAQDAPGLRSTAPFLVAGETSESTPSGALEVTAPAAAIDAELVAEEVELDFRWKEGVVAGTQGNQTLQRHASDEGQRSPSFRNVSVEIGDFQDPVQLLAYPNGSSPAIDAAATGEVTHESRTPAFLTAVGASPSTESSRDGMLGFWYEPSPDWLSVKPLDEVAVNGTFSLFVNNATVTVREDGERVWRNWTGYQEEDTGEVVQRFERHVLHLRLVDATLRLEADDRVGLYSASVDVDTTGVARSRNVEGALQTEEGPRIFDDEPVALRGTGSLHLAKPSGSPTTSGEVPLALSMEQGSDFGVDGGTLASGEDGGAWTPSAPLLAVALILLAGVVAERRTGLAAGVLSRWRSRRYSRWMTRGRDRFEDREYVRAAACFRKAANAEPERGVAWYWRGLSKLEAGENEEAIAVIDEAREGEAIIDELDFLEMEAEASWRLGDRERLRSAVADLAEGSEAMASTLVRDLELDRDVLGEDLAEDLLGDDRGGGLRGYV